MKIAQIKNNKVLQVWASGKKLANLKVRLPEIADELEEVSDSVVCGMIKKGNAFENPPKSQERIDAEQAEKSRLRKIRKDFKDATTVAELKAALRPILKRVMAELDAED